MPSEESLKELAEYLYGIIDEPEAESIAISLGLQIVDRNGTKYYRKKPERLTGNALLSCLVFGATSKGNGEIYGKTNLNGKIVNRSVVETSQAIRGKRYSADISEGDIEINKIKKLLQETS